MSEFLSPQLSVPAQTFLRSAYGLFLLIYLLNLLPIWRLYFLSERWGGYAASDRWTDIIQRPSVVWVCLSLWFLSSILLISGVATIPAALVNLLFSHYYFIQLRWESVSRGMGAPGFMTYWLGWAVFWIELSNGPFAALRPPALLVLQIDFALIIFSSGAYKLASGYLQNEGFQFGLINPQWSYRPDFYMKWPAHHFLFWIWNQGAWITEILSSLLLLIPKTRIFGCALLTGIFIFTATQIRLGVLCEMVILCAILYLAPGSAIDNTFDKLNNLLSINLSQNPDLATITWAVPPLKAFLFFHLFALLFVYMGLAYNFYGRKSLPALLQKVLERYSNLFGIHLWRVFSSDIVNFFVQIYTEEKNSKERKLLTHFGGKGGWRYSHVGEMITLTSLFTTLKYYPNNRELFDERLKRYARTLVCPLSGRLIFEYVSIQMKNDRFEYRPVVSFEIDLAKNEIVELRIDPGISIHEPHDFSRLHAGQRPGSYLPYSSSQA